MTEPFTSPPPLSDGVEAKTRRLANRLRVRRRAGVAGGAALIALLLCGAVAIAVGGGHPAAQVHVAGLPGSEPASSPRGGPTKVVGVTTTTPAVTSVVPGTTTERSVPHATTGAATGSERTVLPGSQTSSGVTHVTTTTLADGTIPEDQLCTAGPKGTVTITPTITATPIAAGQWHVSGTVTITNHSVYTFYSTGVVYLTGAMLPNGHGPAWVGWAGDARVAVGSGDIVGGFVMTAAGTTTTVNLDQTTSTGANGANATTTGTNPPTTIENGRVVGTIGHPWEELCDNRPTVNESFPLGGTFPPPT